jgi:hypothetical protein
MLVAFDFFFIINLLPVLSESPKKLFHICDNEVGLIPKGCFLLFALVRRDCWSPWI